jgi:nucleoid-associated protein YgaU
MPSKGHTTMDIRTKLLVATATGALLASGAQAAPAKKHHTAAKSSANAELLEEVRALRAQVNEMKQRLDVQESAQVNTQEAATAAQTQAAAAAAQAQAAQTQAAAVQTSVPTEVKTQLAANKPKPQWFDSTSISGRMYFNFSNINQKSNGARSANDGTGFNIKRFYLGVDHTFSPIFSANLTMDISNVVGNTSNYNFPANSTTAPANSTALVGRGFYVKKAYLQAKLNPALVLRLGAADLPWVPYVENQYGYRHIENTLIDRLSYGTSADWGIHVLGDLAGGLLSYQVSVIDGAGYRNVKVTNSVDFEGRLSAQYKGFYAAGGFYSGKRGNDVEGTATHHTATRYDALVGYKNKLFNVGGEYYHQTNWNSVTATTRDKGEGYSVFGNVNFMPKWSVFGRYDWVHPDKILTATYRTPELKDHYYNVGLQWEPVKIVDLAVVYKRDSVDNGTLSTTNGTIGGANPSGAFVGGRGTYEEIGLFGQLRF